MSIIHELSGGFDPNDLMDNITHSDMGIQLYVRCQGFIGDVKDYFDLQDI